MRFGRFSSSRRPLLRDPLRLTVQDGAGYTGFARRLEGEEADGVVRLGVAGGL